MLAMILGRQRITRIARSFVSAVGADIYARIWSFYSRRINRIEARVGRVY